jgi:hypothetical protein
MKQTHYNRGDFLNWYLDAFLLVPDPKKWNEELWRENPPRFYRFLRMYALAQGLGLECPLHEVAAGKFIRGPLSTYRNAWDKLVNLSGFPLPLAEFSNLCPGVAFSKLFQFRVAFERVLKFNSGVYECGGTFKCVYLATERMLRQLKPQTIPLDETLCEFIAPHNPQLSKALLVEKYGFPDVDVEGIDANWA